MNSNNFSKHLPKILAAGFVLAFAISFNPSGHAATQNVEYHFINDNDIGCHKPGDPNDSIIHDGVISWTAQITNHGPGSIFIEKAAFHNDKAGCGATSDNVNGNLLSMTGQTQYAEGQIGQVSFAYNMNSFTCGRVQVDAAYRNSDGSGDGLVFLGEIIDYGVDCTNPPPPTNHAPIGWLDAATCDLVGGWATDPDTSSPINVQLYIDGAAGSGTLVSTVSANLNRPDVGQHAFDIRPAPAQFLDGKSHSIYAYAIDSSDGSKVQLLGSPKTISGCTPPNHPPVGVLDAANCDIIGGWAYDPDSSTSSIYVDIYDGQAGSGTGLAHVLTTGLRSDVNAAAGITGNHGFTISTPDSLKDGKVHTIYPYAIDPVAPPNPVLTNAPMTVQCTPTNHPPVGYLDAANCSIIGGWAKDLDTPNDAIAVHIYVADNPNGLNQQFLAPTVANLTRGDVGQHAFQIDTPQSLKDGADHWVYAYGIDSEPAHTLNALLTGSPIKINCPTAPTNHPPVGYLDAANCSIIGGWAKDLDTPNDAIAVHIYVADNPNGLNQQFLAPTVANLTRGDVGQHAFQIDTPQSLKDGADHWVYAYGIDSEPAHTLNALLTGSPIKVKCVTTQFGTIGVTKMVRDVTSGETSFSGSTTARPGDQMEFQMRVTASNGTVGGVTLSDQLPAKLTYVNNSLTVDGAAAGNNPSSVSLSSLTSGQTKVVVMRATVADASQFNPGTVALSNIVNVTSDSNSAQASATVNVNVVTPGSPNLSMTKLARNVTQNGSFVKSISAAPGDSIQFQITVTNNGDGAALNVSVTDNMPTNFNLTSGSVTTNIGTIAPHGSQTVTLGASAAADSSFSCGASTWTNVANASSSNASGVSDSAGIVITRTNNCGGSLNLSISKMVRNVTQNGSFTKSISAQPSDSVQFQITVTNNSTSAAQNVSLTDNWPGNINLTSGSVTTNIGTLSAGASQTVTLSGNIVGDSNFSCGTSTITNSANAQATSANNPSDSATITVNRTNNCGGGSASLSLTKEVRNLSSNGSFSSSANASNNDVVQFRLIVRSTGTLNANNVRVTDSLPAGLSYVQGSFSLDSGSSSGSLFSVGQFLGSITAGSTRTMTFNATVNSASVNTLTNTAQASADNTGNATAQATVFVGSVQGGNVSLTLSKRAFNQTQNVDAATVTAHSNDLIVYTLSVRNTGNTTASGYIFQDDISDILQLAMLEDFGTATFDMGNLLLKWPATDIPASATMEKTFSVRVRSTFPANSDNVMTNSFGNTVSITVNKPAVAGVFTAPKTGSTTTISLTLAALTLAGFAAWQKKTVLKSVLDRIR